MSAIQREIRTLVEIEDLETQVSAAVKRSVKVLSDVLNGASELDAFAKLKFEQTGHHPLEERTLNLFEQINQTFTYLASLRAARWIFVHHPDAGILHLNLGTAAGSDIEALDGSLAAETFASVDPRNNNKLQSDVRKVAQTLAKHKYVFFLCPKHPAAIPVLTKYNQHVWVVSLGWP
ncbi:MAG: hypothetical protein WCH07_06835 [Deltaproteobacteria bacterium]